MSLRSDNAPRKEFQDFNFNKETDFHVEEILQYANSLNEEWLLYTDRQNEKYEDRVNPHLYTKTYIIQDHPLLWKFGSKIESTVKDEKAFDLIKNIVTYLEDEYVGKSARILLIKLEAGKNVAEHVDGGDYLSTVRRFHIPLATNDSVFYIVNDEKINMSKGECWEINNFKPHSVLNNSEEDRIHLLIDILPEYACYSLDGLEENKIKIIEDFIEEKDADAFFSYINDNKLNTEKFPLTRGKRDFNRDSYQANIPETVNLSMHEEIKDLMIKYSEKVLNEFKLFFADEELYTSAFWMTSLGKDVRLPWHVDNHVNAEHLYRSAIIYLNDDYDGGFLQIENPNFTYKPKKYSLIIFPSTYSHRITKIKSGNRVALPIWASTEKEYDIFNEQ